LKLTANLNIELLLALNYIFKNKRAKFISFNALFSILSVTFAIIVLVVIVSVMDGFGAEFEKRIIGTGSHINIQKFGGENEFQSLKKTLLRNTLIKNIAPYVSGQVIHYYGREVYTFSVQGVDAEVERKVSNIEEVLVTGSMCVDSKDLLIGKELADTFSYQLGDKLKLRSPITDKLETFVVKGIFYTGIYHHDLNLIYITLKDSQRIFNMGNSITGIRVQAKKTSNVNTIKTFLLSRLGPEYDVYTWMDLNKSLIGALKIEKKIMFIILSMLLVLAGFNISSTLMMSFMYKKREVGILKSLGFRNNQIKNIFLFQGILICFIGITIGLLIGIVIITNINLISDFFKNVIGLSLFPTDIYYLDKIPTSLNGVTLLLIIGFSFIVSIIASYYPALKASKLSPAEIIKNG
jgi:lipoprotein-releasing system permease protein